MTFLKIILQWLLGYWTLKMYINLLSIEKETSLTNLLSINFELK